VEKLKWKIIAPVMEPDVKKQNSDLSILSRSDIQEVAVGVRLMMALLA